MNPWLLFGGLLTAIVMAGGGYYTGWEQRGEHEIAVQAAAKDKIVAEWVAKVKEQKEIGDGLLVKLEDERRNIKTVTVEIIKEIPKYTTVYKESPDAPLQTIPVNIYTRGFVRMWDRALTTELSSTSIASSELADKAGDADLVRAKIATGDILSNHVENAAKYADCRAQLNRIIDWHEQIAKSPH